jgi:hypothetical protein
MRESLGNNEERIGFPTQKTQNKALIEALERREGAGSLYRIAGSRRSID